MPQLTGLWRNPAFVRFWAADTISIFGSLITRIALPFTAILVLDASAFEVSLLALADLVPSFVVGLPAGVWVDRMRRLPMMIASDLGRAAVLITVPIAAALDALTLGHLYAVAFVSSGLTVVFNIAQISALPSLVSRDELVEANSKTGATQSISEVGAFGIGGWLVQLLSGPGAIVIDAASYVVSALLLKTVRAEESPPERDASPGMRREVVEGLQVVLREPILRAIAASSAALWFGFSIFGTIISLFALRELGFAAGPLAMIFAAGGISSLLGSLFTARITAALGVGRAMTGGILIAGLLLLPLALATDNGAFAVACLLLQQAGDGAIMLFMINEVSLRQAIAEPAVQGRVNSTNEFVRSIARLLGIVVAGVAGELFGLRATLAIGGVVVVLGGIGLAMSSLRRLQTIPPLPVTGRAV